MNLAAGIGKTAQLLGFTLMDWQQQQVNSVATEHVDGVPVYRQVVLEVMRQQGKTVDLLSMMVAAALRRPGTQIAYAAQTRLDARSTGCSTCGGRSSPGRSCAGW